MLRILSLKFKVGFLGFGPNLVSGMSGWVFGVHRSGTTCVIYRLHWAIRRAADTADKRTANSMEHEMEYNGMLPLNPTP